MSMRISELSRRAGVGVPTVKYYLREGLLPAGRATAPTQAEYDEAHVARLRLVRALTDVGGLSLAATRQVLAVVDGSDELPLAVGTAHELLSPAVPAGAPPPDRALALTASLGWRVDARSAALHQLDAALRATQELGVAPDPAALRTYAAAALQVARADVAGVPAAGSGDDADAVSFVVLGTVLYEPILLALRRLAQQHLYVEVTAEDG
jgi:DNA-binding transcriptional MerR regulator